MKIKSRAEFTTHQDLDLLIMEENLEISFVSEHFEIHLLVFFIELRSVQGW